MKYFLLGLLIFILVISYNWLNLYKTPSPSQASAYLTTFGFSIPIQNDFLKQIEITEEDNILLFHYNSKSSDDIFIGGVAEINTQSEYKTFFSLIYSYNGKLYGYLAPEDSIPELSVKTEIKDIVNDLRNSLIALGFEEI